jgi:uncharacterized protein (UPF0147 family)
LNPQFGLDLGIVFQVMQLWQKIVQNNAVPKSKFLMVVDLAIGRVMDKSSNVCKNAISLLKSILEHNPYGVKVNYFGSYILIL